MDEDIRKFVDSVEAVKPDKDNNAFAKWRKTFKRPNYFLFKGKMMIVKISRSKKPFWGIGKKYIDLLSCLDDYFVVLLISEREGWVFSKNEVSSNISSKRWNLREADNNYKINFPLPDSNSFSSPSNFLERV